MFQKEAETEEPEETKDFTNEQLNLSDEIIQVFDYDEQEEEEEGVNIIAYNDEERENILDDKIVQHSDDEGKSQKADRFKTAGALDIRQDINTPKLENDVEQEISEGIFNLITDQGVIEDLEMSPEDNEDDISKNISEEFLDENVSEMFGKIKFKASEEGKIKEDDEIFQLNKGISGDHFRNAHVNDIRQDFETGNVFPRTNTDIDIPEEDVESDQSQEDSDIQAELNDSNEGTADEITRPLGKLFLEINDKIERIQGKEETTTRTSVRNNPSLETLFYEDINLESSNDFKDNQKTKSLFLFPGDKSSDKSFLPEISKKNSIDNIEVPLPSFEVNLSGEEDSFLLTKGDIVSNFKNRFFSNEIIEENDAIDGKAVADEITHDNWIDPTDARHNSLLDDHPISISPGSGQTHHAGNSLPVRFEISSIKSGHDIPDPLFKNSLISPAPAPAPAPVIAPAPVALAPLAPAQVPAPAILAPAAVLAHATVQAPAPGHNNEGQVKTFPVDDNLRHAAPQSNLESDNTFTAAQISLVSPSLQNTGQDRPHLVTTEGPRIFTLAPMTFQSASGRIRMPVTLQYGFEPMTVKPRLNAAQGPKLFSKPLDRKQNPQNLKQNPQPPKLFNKSIRKQRVKPRRVNVVSFYQQETVLDKLSNLIQNFRNVLV